MRAAPARNTPSGLDASERRILNPRPYRVFRRSYPVVEAKAGAVVVLLVACVGAWVAWRGTHADPGLTADPALLAPAKVSVPEGAVTRGRRAPDDSGPGRASSSPAAADGRSAGAAAPARGTLPPGLAAPGWTEGELSLFDAENLYEKIDGRADFFLARGFRSLTFVTLSGPSEAAVDVELYDLGSPENSLGAFSAEKPPETKAASGGGTSWYLARNALFVARGPVYVRAIGSDESAVVLAQLERLRKALESGIAAGEKPWAVALFGDALGIPPDRLQYAAENAFSFGFARNVSSATLDDGETELFVLPAGSAAKATALAAEFERGFLSYGEKADVAGATWVKDRYLGAFSRTTVAGTMVVGARGAPDAAKAGEALAKLARAVLSLPPGVAARAAAGPPAIAKANGGARE